MSYEQSEAREELVQLMAEALDACGEIDLNADELEEAANYAAGVVFFADPRLIAEAMGGYVRHVYTDGVFEGYYEIRLPPRKVES